MWIYLKLQDKTIARYNIDISGKEDLVDNEVLYVPGSIEEFLPDDQVIHYEIYNNDLMPFYLRDMAPEKEILENWHYFPDYINHRMLEYGRKGFKRLSAQYNIPDSLCGAYMTIRPYIMVMRGLSASDDYWLTPDPNEKWADICPRTNDLHFNVSQLALDFSDYFSDRESQIISPEYSNKGGGMRHWIKKENGLFLRKYDHYKNPNEVERLLEVSKFLDHSNVPHVKYYEIEDEYCGHRCINGKGRGCECECFATDEYSFVNYMDLFNYWNRTETDFINLMFETDEAGIYKELIANFIIGNELDLYDFGFMMNNKTGKLEKIAPMLGYSNCFKEDFNVFGFFPKEIIDKNKVKQYFNKCEFDTSLITSNNFIKKQVERLRDMFG